MAHLIDRPVRPPRTPSLPGWLAVSSVAFGTFVMVTAEFLPIGLLSPMARDLSVSDGTAGLMVTAPGAVAAVAAPVAAAALRRADRRGLLLGLTLLVLVANVLAATAHGFAVMLAGRCLLGVAVGAFWAFAGAVGRRLVDDRQGATATAVILAGISLGTVLGLPLGTLIGHWAGWRAAFQVGTALSLVALAGQWALLPRLAPEAGAALPDWGEALRHPLLRAGFLFAALVILGHFTAYTYLEPYLTQGVGLSPDGLGLALAGYGVAGLAGNFAGAHLAERDLPRTFLGMAALLALSVLALVLCREGAGLAVPAVVAWGAAFGAVPACIQTWLYRASPVLFETSSAFMVTVFEGALAGGAGIGGVVADRFDPRAALSLGLAVVAAGVVAMVVFSRRFPSGLDGPSLSTRNL